MHLRSKIIIDFRIARRIISPFILFRSSINKLFTVDPCLFKKGEKFTCIDLNNHHSARNSTIISQRFAIHLSRTLSPIENALSLLLAEKKKIAKKSRENLKEKYPESTTKPLSATCKFPDVKDLTAGQKKKKRERMGVKFSQASKTSRRKEISCARYDQTEYLGPVKWPAYTLIGIKLSRVAFSNSPRRR